MKVKPMTTGEKISCNNWGTSLNELRGNYSESGRGAKALAAKIDAAIRRALAKQAKEANANAMTLAHHAAAGTYPLPGRTAGTGGKVKPKSGAKRGKKNVKRI